jgi:predicted dithiol-disulfide oxidoreductase (DUF899 family)
MQAHKVVSREAWLAREEHLVKEKAFTKARDRLSAERRALPWVKVDKPYLFATADGEKTLGELFDRRSQLVVYHFMLGPEWGDGCPSCSLLADHFDGAAMHLANRDVTLIACSRAPLPEIDAYRRRMGWRFPWVSSFGSDFNYDYHVSARPEDEAAGRSTITRSRISVATRCRAPACSSRTPMAPSSTAIRPMHAASTS